MHLLTGCTCPLATATTQHDALIIDIRCAVPIQGNCAVPIWNIRNFRQPVLRVCNENGIIKMMGVLKSLKLVHRNKNKGMQN